LGYIVEKREKNKRGELIKQVLNTFFFLETGPFIWFLCHITPKQQLQQLKIKTMQYCQIWAATDIGEWPMANFTSEKWMGLVCFFSFVKA